MIGFRDAAPGRRQRGPGALLAPLVARLYLRRPELSELVAIKYGSPRALLAAVYNESLFRLRRPGFLPGRHLSSERARWRIPPTSNF